MIHGSRFRSISKRALSSQSSPPTTPLDLFQCNSNITALFRSGNSDAARRLFDEMRHKNTVAWNCMISGYGRNYDVSNARKVFDAMPHRDIASWGALLNAYIKCGELNTARKLFDDMPERNVICWNSMITGYVAGGRIKNARKLFDEMPVRNGTSWSVMISGYLRCGCVDEARSLLDRAPVLEPSRFNTVLSMYVELGRKEDASALFSKMGQRDVVSWNTMIMCHLKAGETDLAQEMFDEMPVKDIVSWTTMVHGYLRHGDVDRARTLFDEMPVRDTVAWNTMISGYVQNGMLDDALRLFHEMPSPDVITWNSILQGYVQSDDTDNMRIWFDAMPHKDETSWNSLISGYRNEEALHEFRRMIQEGFTPDQGTFAVVISVCASLAALGCGRMAHLQAVGLGYEHDMLVSSSLITMYSKCGLIAECSRVFSHMVRWDTVAWNAVIVARAYHGYSLEAFELFSLMIQDGYHPDHVTFLGLLSACAHCGMVKEGLEYFKSMQEVWKLAPKPEHYACIVHLLGRSGSISGAYEFIESVPEELQANTWETLSSACSEHGNLELAEIAVRKVLDLQPMNGGMHVILANIYVAKGMWEDAARIRESMKKHGAKKEAACSWIELEGKVWLFGQNHKPHSKMEEICKVLYDLSTSMEGIS